MTHLSHELALALKEAGFPQPKPEIWQIWHVYGDQSMVAFVYQEKVAVFRPNHQELYLTKERFDQLAVFAPDIEHLMSRLPNDCRLEKHGGFPSCRYEHEEIPRRTTGATLTEAAAKMWLELHTKKP